MKFFRFICVIPGFLLFGGVSSDVGKEGGEAAGRRVLQDKRPKGGYGHQEAYKPHPPKCHPQTITKYKTVYKDRKANVYNQVEILNPQPQVKKIKEERYTTIRYPVFITQVIKPLLTQVETKVKPVFFTKTINKYTTVLFTVTGIGQVTVTSLKYEKEYITRCLKKGYEHEDHGGHHRSDFVDDDRLEDISVPLEKELLINPTKVLPPHGVTYDNLYPQLSRENAQQLGKVPRNPRRPDRYFRVDSEPLPPRSRGVPWFPVRRIVGRQGYPEMLSFPGEIGQISDLYSSNMYYYDSLSRKRGRAYEELEPSRTFVEYKKSFQHPPLVGNPFRIAIDAP